MYMDRYLDQIKREAAERRAKREAETATKSADPMAELKARITHWHQSLAPELKPPYFFMSDLSRQFRCTPQQLGIALDELGWNRRRTWKKGAPYRNRWFPPEATGENGNIQQV